MKRFVPFAVLAVALYGALVLIEAYRSDEPFTFLSFGVDLIEMSLLAGTVAMTAFVSIEMRNAKQEPGKLARDLADARRDGERWRKAARGHVEGLSRAIARQFDEWGLTGAEADVAGLMLKGLSQREIAGLRSGLEATVRQHAAAVYRKSALPAGRSSPAFSSKTCCRQRRSPPARRSPWFRIETWPEISVWARPSWRRQPRLP